MHWLGPSWASRGMGGEAEGAVVFGGREGSMGVQAGEDSALVTFQSS